MKFCKKCGGLMLPVKGDPKSGKIEVACRNCGAKETTKQEGFVTSKDFSQAVAIPVIDSEKEAKKLSTINVECPKCGNIGAMWWLVQTRGVDEPTTRFYKCVKCRHTWREFS